MADFSIVIQGPSDPKFGWLSVSSPHSFQLDGQHYATVEQYLALKKFEGTPLEEKIRKAGTSAKIKLITRPRTHIFYDSTSESRTRVPVKKIVYGDDLAFARGDWSVSKQFHLERATRAKLKCNPKLLPRFRLIEGLKIVDEENPESAAVWEKIRGELSSPVEAVKKYAVSKPKIDLKNSDLTPDEVHFLEKLATGGAKTLPKKLSYIPALPEIEKWVSSIPFPTVIRIMPVYAALVRNVQTLLFGRSLVSTEEGQARLKISILAAAVVRWLRLDAEQEDIAKIFSTSAAIATSELGVLYDFSPQGPIIFVLPGNEKILVSGPATEEFFEVDCPYGDEPSVTFPRASRKKVLENIYSHRPELRRVGWFYERVSFLVSIHEILTSSSVTDFRLVLNSAIPSQHKRGSSQTRKIESVVEKMFPGISPVIRRSMSKNFPIDLPSGHEGHDVNLGELDEISGLVDPDVSVSEERFLGIFANLSSEGLPLEKISGMELARLIFTPELYQKFRKEHPEGAVPEGASPKIKNLKSWRKKYSGKARVPKRSLKALATCLDFFHSYCEESDMWVTLSIWKSLEIFETLAETELPEEPEPVKPEIAEPLKQSEKRAKSKKTGLLEIEDRPLPEGGEVISIEGDILEVCSQNSSNPSSPVGRYDLHKIWILVVANSTGTSTPAGRAPSKTTRSRVTVNLSESVTKRVYTAFPGTNVYTFPGREGAYPLGEAIVSKTGEFERARPNIASLIAEYSAGTPKKNTDSAEARKEWFVKGLSSLAEKMDNGDVLVVSNLTLYPDGYESEIRKMSEERGLVVYLVAEKEPVATAPTRKTRSTVAGEGAPETTVIPVD